MDIKNFVLENEAHVRQNKRLYKILDFLSVTLFLLLVAVLLNIGDLFKLIPFLEPYVGLSPDIPFFQIRYDTIILLFICAGVTYAALYLYRRYRSKIYIWVGKVPPKDENSFDIMERLHPELKDRLRTAYDNLEDNNVIAADLKQQISKDIEGISGKELMNKKKARSGAIAVAVSGILLLAIFFTGFTSPIDPASEITRRLPDFSVDRPDVDPNNNTTVNESASSVAVGTPPISEDPGIDIDVTLPPGSGFGPGELLNESDNKTFEPSKYYPPESLSSTHFYDTLPEGYADLIKNYFEKLAETS
ncbi:DUF7502 family protein [Methanolapillus millepedarum]|uniref:Uncharacterized protein n=1 Tax=Methanolapillus millepedarum TaxID=3028296 RepID=A0AA96V189_9EURY|nr:hypothetical protein MsAc7_00740 [Methanosarcinaceae archaeon Ac7]